MSVKKLCDDDWRKIKGYLEKDGMSATDVANIYGVSRRAICDGALRRNIEIQHDVTKIRRERARKIQAAAEEKVRRDLASEMGVQRGEGFEEGLVEASAVEQARVMKLHKSGATEVRQTVASLLAELQAQCIPKDKLLQLVEMAAHWETQDLDFDEQDKKREEAITTFIALLGLGGPGGRADTAQKLVNAFTKVVELERKVYGIKDEAGETDAVKALKELIGND